MVTRASPQGSCLGREEGREKRGKREEGRKKEEGRRKKEEGRRKKEEGCCCLCLWCCWMIKVVSF